MSIVEQKSLLAKLMATENLTIQQAKVETASFDVLNRVLTVPILDFNISKELYDLFMGHEVGHALYTPLEGMRKAKENNINMSILNVVEDSRIERKIKNKYPGIRYPFIKAYGELYENNFFETDGKNVSDFNLIDRINLHCKIGASLALPFTEEERQLLNKVETTETYDDVVEVTKQICDYMKSQFEQEEMEITKVKVRVVSNDDSEMEESDEMDGENNSSEDSVVDENQPVDGDPSDENNDTKTQKNDSSVASNGASKDVNSKEIRSYTDDAYRKNEEKLFSSEYSKFVYANIPEYDMRRIMDYKKVYSEYRNLGYEVPLKSFSSYRRESSKVVSYLVKEFELRKNAEQMKRTSTSKTGELNMNKIYSYNFADDIFKKMAITPQGKSHGLVMFLDWSGSMYKHIGNTVKQLLNLAMFCKKVNIPFEVYCFVESTYHEYMNKQSLKSGDLVLGSFGLLNILSSRMNASDFSTAGAALMKISGINDDNRYSRIYAPEFMKMNGTPLNESIIAAMEIVPHFQKNNNLQIVNTVFLTDGDGNNLHHVYAMDRIDNSNYTHMYIRDPKTKNEEVFRRNAVHNSAAAQTDCFIRLLKQRTNSHVIGFYVCESKELMYKSYTFFPQIFNEQSEIEKQKKLDEIKTEFKNKNFCVVTSTGFDDYYLLRSNGLDTDDDEELSFKDNSTTRGMVSIFSKYTGKKINSRVVLNRFIDLIT